MAKPVFQLKRSRLALVFQLLLFALLTMVLYELLITWLWLLCVILALITYMIFLNMPYAERLEYLDAGEWSLQYCHPDSLLRVHIRQVVDHHLYVVIYFEDAKIKPLVIWRDQLSLVQWKDLKRLANLA